MHGLLSLIAGREGDTHRAVFATFATGLARMLARRVTQARVRALGN